MTESGARNSNILDSDLKYLKFSNVLYFEKLHRNVYLNNSVPFSDKFDYKSQQESFALSPRTGSAYFVIYTVSGSAYSHWIRVSTLMLKPGPDSKNYRIL